MSTVQPLTSAFELCAALMYTGLPSAQRERRFERLLLDRGIGTRLTKGERAARALEEQGELALVPSATRCV